MTISQILIDSSKENRSLAWAYHRRGKKDEFKKRMSYALANIKRAKQERQIEQKWKLGAVA